MKALTLIPKKTNSISIKEIPEPEPQKDELLCQMLAVGICGTDFEIREGKYGEAPEGSEYLILGHESLGRVLKAPPHSSFKAGDLVVGFVRQPDPIPCPACARGEWDMCRNGLYQEHGIKGLHGFAAEKYVILDKHAIKIDPCLESVGVLMEPTSVVAKAWEQSFRIASRSTVAPKKALITGSGPVGLLAAMIGAQRGLEIHLLDHNETGPKPELAKLLGAIYHSDVKMIEGGTTEFDITMECTGKPEIIAELFKKMKPDGILCLTGVSSGGRTFPTDIGALNLGIVLQNEVIFGSVNANRRHYEAAHDALLKADLTWLQKLITRKVPLSQFETAFEKQKTDIKVVLQAENPRV